MDVTSHLLDCISLGGLITVAHATKRRRPRRLSMSIPTNPPSPLGVYRVLSPNAGLRISPLQLGGMIVRDKTSGESPPLLNQQEAFDALDAFYKLGGNVVDTANLP